MLLSDYLSTERVVPNVGDGDVRAILTQLLQPLLLDGSLTDPEPMLSALLALPALDAADRSAANVATAFTLQGAICFLLGALLLLPESVGKGCGES